MSEPATPEARWRQTWRLFHAALEKPQAERAGFLDTECADDDLRREVDELLAAHEEGSDVLDEPLSAVLTRGPGPQSEDAAPLEEGTVLAGRFEVVRLAGRGGMGEVYEAEDRELGGRVAVKVLRPSLAGSPRAVARFRKEILLARQVTHRNACRVFDLFEDEGRLLLTMELLHGETLAARLAREGPLPLEEIRPLLEQLIAGLEAAHVVGVVHRDLKPSNVMLVEEPDGMRAVLTDFGMATTDSRVTDKSAAQLTGTGEILGTPAYMAPEQLEGRDVGPATDVYGLGLLLFEMVTGHLPFEGATPFAIAHRRLEGPAPSPRSLVPSLDLRWEAIILRCLERQPADRPQRPREVVQALDDDRAPFAGGRTGMSVRVGVAAALAVALGLTAIWWLGRDALPAASSEDIGAARQDDSMAASQKKAGEVVLVAQFVNDSGDPDFDGVVEAAVSHELSLSTSLTAVSRARLGDTLRLMRLSPDTALDADVSREVALRDGGVGALLSGTIERAGAALLLSGELISVADGALLMRWSQEVAEDPPALAEAVRSLSFAVRRALGESLPVGAAAGYERVTTTSFRALRLYDEAESIITRYGLDSTAEELLRAALREDPEFASAHLLLASSLANQRKSAEEYLPHAERAVELSEGLPERELYFIRGLTSHLKGDLEKARANYDALLRLYPDHYWANNNLARLVRPEDGVALEVRKATYRPNDLDANWDAAHALAIVGARPGEAAGFIDRVVEIAAVEIPPQQHFEAAWARLWPAHELWVSGDVVGARNELDRWAARLEAMSGDEALWSRMLLLRGYRALGLSARSREMAPAPDYRLSRRFFAGWEAAQRGDVESVGERLAMEGWEQQGFMGGLLWDPMRVALLARGGALEEARTVVDEFRTRPRARAPSLEAEPRLIAMMMDGEVALAERRLEEAAETLERFLLADRREFGPSYFLASQALAVSYRELGRADDAIAVLEGAGGAKSRSFPFATEIWLQSQLDLALLYRSLGREVDAEAILASLVDSMQLADPGFWLVERLAAPAGRGLSALPAG